MSTNFNIRSVNKAIAHTGLALRNGNGYFYWIDLSTGCLPDVAIPSVYVNSVTQMTLEQWVTWAESTAKQWQADKAYASQP